LLTGQPRASDERLEGCLPKIITTNMEKQKKINLFKSLAVRLHNQSLWFFKRAFQLKPKKITKSYIKTFLAGLGMPISRLMFADNYYYYVSIEEMEDLINFDWTDQKKYVKSVYDCDDFALTFKSHIIERFHINSVGLARSIQLKDIDTGAHIGYHRANVFLASDNNVMKLYFLEPQTDKYVEVKNYNELIELTGWKNKLNIFDF